MKDSPTEASSENPIFSNWKWLIREDSKESEEDD
jgi:hypothetical protein